MLAETFLAHAPPSADRAYLDAVAGLPAQGARPLSLRLHLPCLDGEAALDTYLAYLRRELAMQAALFGAMGSIRQLRFDGAAPACLPGARLASLLACLRVHFHFTDDDGGDFEAAVDPDAMPPGRLACLRGQGFNSIRFEYRGGPASHAQLLALAAAAGAAGFRARCVALAYGMPGQGAALLERMLAATLAAAPERVLLCHRPGPGRDEGALSAASPARRMQQLCAERLHRAGYTLTGAGQFARPHATPDDGGLQYRPGTHLVGCGVGALGAVGPVLCQNVEGLRDYYALLDRNTLPQARVLRRMRGEQTRPYLMQVKDFQDADQ